jgi:hypothetical protein
MADRSGARETAVDKARRRAARRRDAPAGEGSGSARDSARDSARSNASSAEASSAVESGDDAAYDNPNDGYDDSDGSSGYDDEELTAEPSAPSWSDLVEPQCPERVFVLGGLGRAKDDELEAEHLARPGRQGLRVGDEGRAGRKLRREDLGFFEPRKPFASVSNVERVEARLLREQKGSSGGRGKEGDASVDDARRRHLDDSVGAGKHDCPPRGSSAREWFSDVRFCWRPFPRDPRTWPALGYVSTPDEKRNTPRCVNP